MGQHLENPAAVKEEVVDFYKRLLGTKFVRSRDGSGIGEIIQSKVPRGCHGALITPVTAEEIKKAISRLKEIKLRLLMVLMQLFSMIIGMLLDLMLWKQ